MSTSTPSRPVVLSGIQANGSLHIGNYIGALRQWVAGQDTYTNYFCIADLHALTVPDKVGGFHLRESTRSIAALYLACGIDPERSVVFRQSQVREHTDLLWVLSCVTPLGLLHRMTQYKAKAQGEGGAGELAGLLTYPVLMAADILLYKADLVPVGEDQRQHLEVTRDIAKKFNHLFGDVFPEPQTLTPTVGARVMGLDEPTEKMSKSLALTRPNHAIGLLDPPDRIRKAVKAAVTDTAANIDYATASPGVQNLLSIIAALEGTEPQAVSDRLPPGKYGPLKDAAYDAVMAVLGPLQERHASLMADPDGLERLLADGADRATAVASRTMTEVRAALDL